MDKRQKLLNEAYLLIDSAFKKKVGTYQEDTFLFWFSENFTETSKAACEIVAEYLAFEEEAGGSATEEAERVAEQQAEQLAGIYRVIKEI